MRILVIGGTGFIGKHLSKKLAEKHDVQIISRRKFSLNSNASKVDNISYSLGDIADLDFINDSCKNIDCLINLASTVVPSTSNKNPIYDIQTNLIGAMHTLQAAIKNGISKYMFLSSGGTIYGSNNSLNSHSETDPTDPICSYGVVKLCIEKYIHMFNELYGLPYSIIRLSNPYGPEYSIEKPQGVIHHFVSKAINNEKISIWGDGSVERDFIYIDDVVSALCKALEYPKSRSLFNIGSGTSTSVKTIHGIISDISGSPPQITYEPSRPCDVQRSVLNINHAKSELIWEPKIPIVDGIRITYHNTLKKISDNEQQS